MTRLDGRELIFWGRNDCKKSSFDRRCRLVWQKTDNIRKKISFETEILLAFHPNIYLKFSLVFPFNKHFSYFCNVKDLPPNSIILNFSRNFIFNKLLNSQQFSKTIFSNWIQSLTKPRTSTKILPNWCIHCKCVWRVWLEH